jgi:hypothetical protein
MILSISVSLSLSLSLSVSFIYLSHPHIERQRKRERERHPWNNWDQKCHTSAKTVSEFGAFEIEDFQIRDA